MANDRGNPAQAVEMLERGLRLFSTLSDKRGIAHSRMMLGLVCFFRGDVSAARPHVETSLAISREIRDRLGTAWSLYLISMLLALEGHAERASSPIEESISILETLGDRRNLAYATQIRGLAALAIGDTHSADRAEKESMVVFQELGDGYGLCCGMSFLTAVMLAEKKEESALHLAGAVASYRERTGVAFPALVKSYLERVEGIRRDLGNAADQAFTEGYAMDLDQAVAYALQIE